MNFFPCLIDVKKDMPIKYENSNNLSGIIAAFVQLLLRIYWLDQIALEYKGPQYKS